MKINMPHRRIETINKSNSIFIGMIGIINILTFMKMFSKIFSGQYIDDFISLVCLLFGLIMLMNIKEFINAKYFIMDYCILFIVLVIRINILNGYIKCDIQNYVAVMLVISEVIFHIYVIKTLKVPVRRKVITFISSAEIEKYILNRIRRDSGSIVSEHDKLIKVYMWIVFSAFLAILLFAGKFIIDIKNLFSPVYLFGSLTVIIYIILNVFFFMTNYFKAKVAGLNVWKEMVQAVLFMAGINLFVFAQRDTARFSILVLAAYLCSLYVMNTQELIHRINSLQEKSGE